MKLDMKQDLNILFEVCFFSVWLENQYGRFGLLLA